MKPGSRLLAVALITAAIPTPAVAQISLIANLTNDAWFGDTTEPWIHLALAKLRAIEHRRYFVRSTNSGVSAIIDPVGRVVVSTPTFEQTARVSEVRWQAIKRPISRH